jgi:hypothetical protein
MTTYDYIPAVQLAGLADNAAVNTGNMGSVSGLALAIVLGGGGTATKAPTTGALRLKHNTSGAARIDLSLTTPTNTLSVLMKVQLPTTNPSSNSRILEVMDSQGTPASKLRVDHLSATGQGQLYNAANSGVFNTTPDLSGIVYVTVGEEVAASSPTITNGKLRMNVYDSTYTLIGSTTFSNDTSNTINALASTLKTVRAGRINSITDTGDLDIIYIRISDSQITPLGPIAAPPAIDVFEGTTPFFEYDARGSTSGGGGALTYSITHVSGTNNLAGTREPIDGWFFVPQDTASAVYTITASEGGNTDSQNVTVPAVAAGAPSGGVRRRRYNGSTLV